MVLKKFFKKIYSYLNLIEDNNFQQTEEVYTQSLIKEIKKRPTFDEKLAYIKTKTKLFNEFESKQDIITYGRKKSNVYMISMSLAAAGAGLIPVPFADTAIVLNILGTTIIKIGQAFGYVWKKISKEDLLSIYKGELYYKKNKTTTNNNSLMELYKVIGEILLKGIITTILLNIDDVIKSFWGVGTFLGMVIGSAADSGIILKYSSNAKHYFESKCREDDGTIFFCTRCSEYEVIFRKFKQFENFDLVYPSD